MALCILLNILIILGPFLALCCFHNMLHDPSAMSQDALPEEFGKPLFLTPIIESGDVERAKRMSKVGHFPNAPKIKSYSGFLTVNKNFSSNLFFWFFPAINDDHSAPIIVWLQGGPGLSSLIGVFVENGPYAYDRRRDKLVERNESWANKFNMLYIDNPVGAGFSFTEKTEGYATNQNQIADELYEALNQFFTIFHNYKENNLYLFGEGFACKYVAGLAHKLKIEDGGPQRLELKGIAIGNGICDAMTVLNHTEYLVQTGLIDKKQSLAFHNHTTKLESLVARRKWSEAKAELSRMFLDQANNPSYFREITGIENLFDIRYTKYPKELYLYTKYLASAEVRKALHVGSAAFNNYKTVCNHLDEDLLQSVKPWLEKLANSYKVMFYHGHLDIVTPYSQSVKFIRSLKWKHSEEKVRRMIWTYHGGKDWDKKFLGGYVHHIGDFYEVLVWRAGHFVPIGNPKAAEDMVSRFIWGKSFH